MKLTNPPPIDTVYIPSGGIVAPAQDQFIVPVWDGNGGSPTKGISVTVLSTSTVAIEEVRRFGNEWVYDGTLARDTSVTLSQTMTDVGNLTCFAMQNPVAESAAVLFLVFNQASAAPDALVINSIDMAGGTTLTAVAVTIAGANAPPAADLIGAVGGASATNKIKFMSQDDWYSADLTGTVAGFTMTFTDAAVSAVDTSIDVTSTSTRRYSMYCIGTTFLLMYGGITGAVRSATTLSMWTVTTAGVKVAEYLNVAVGGQIPAGTGIARVFAMDGSFAIAAPEAALNGGIGGSFRVRKIPLSQLVAN